MEWRMKAKFFPSFPDQSFKGYFPPKKVDLIPCPSFFLAKCSHHSRDVQQPFGGRMLHGTRKRNKLEKCDEDGHGRVWGVLNLLVESFLGESGACGMGREVINLIDLVVIVQEGL